MAAQGSIGNGIVAPGTASTSATGGKMASLAEVERSDEHVLAVEQRRLHMQSDPVTNDRRRVKLGVLSIGR